VANLVEHKEQKRKKKLMRSFTS